MAEPDDFPRLDSLLDGALDCPPEDRARHLAEVCGSDAALRERLERLIALAEGAEDVLPPGGALRGALWEDLAHEIGGADRELRAGERLGRYEVRALLGVGGMGRVYQAYDPTLGREVAIKALTGAVPDDAPESRRRFEREARLLATLNHPNIAAIYGFELIEGAPYLVLELVEGRTLAERLQRGALPVEEAVGIALQVALALEEAHRKGVVHRDLKPANVKLGPEGRVKVLDFGIAKAVALEPVGNTREVPASTVTGAGAVLGTAPYMSPEQVRGEPADTRTDVWAFGCLLYEMLAGRPVFRGSSPAEVMAAVLRDDVEWSRLPPGTPAALRRLLRRCLRRDLRERLQDIGDARLELSEPGSEDLGDVGRPRPAQASLRGVLLALLAVVVLAGWLGVWIGRSSERTPPRGAVRLSLELPAGLAIADDFSAPFAVSPDGSRLVVLATKHGTARLYQRAVDRLETAPIPGTEGAWQPSFSPDGREVVFFADRKLKRVSLDGGPVLALAEVGGNSRGAGWGPDGTIVLAPSGRSALARVDASGGVPTPLTQLDLGRGEGTHRWPQMLPGGRWVLFTVGILGASFDDARLEAVSLDTGERRRLLGSAAQGWYAGGRLFFAQAGRLFAAPFDPATLRVGGTPQVVLEGVRYDPRNGGTHLALSDSGTLVYRPAVPTPSENYLAWVDAAGSLSRIGDTPRRFREPSLSPDGRRIAAGIGSEAESDLWILETERGTLSRLSFGLSPRRPVWAPDGRGITVAAEQDGRWKLLTLPAAGAGPAATLLEGPNRMYPSAWSPDRRLLVFEERRPGTGWDLRLLEVGADGRTDGAPRDLATTRFEEVNAALSPDGRFIAYESDELDGIAGIYVAPLARPGEKVRAIATGARFPRWGTAEQLYYWYPTRARPRADGVVEGLHRIDWREDGARLAQVRSASVWGGGPRVSALLARLVVASFAGYGVDASGARPRFLVLETSAATVDAPLERPVVVLNWFEDLRSRAAQRR